ncbi:MAG: hypothetical protein J6Y42_02305 [Bacilli bacterium]|nr:hypothetical protein [Bacilli bacterium]
MNKKIKKIISRLLVILIFILLLGIIIIRNEDKQANKKIKEFVERASLVYTSSDTEYYKISKEYEYEDINTRIIENYDSNNIGTTGDIYLTSTDWGSSFFTKYICEKLRVGHCGIVYDEHANSLYEIVGNNGKNNVVKLYDNDWYDLNNFNEMIVLRVKDIDSEDRDEIKAYLDKIAGSKYNFFFIFHMKNRFYCTDLATETYKRCFKTNINKFFISTGSSMIKDDNTYLIYYKREVNKDNIKYEVYYLGD